MENFKKFIIWLYPKFHVFTVVCTVCFLGWEAYNYNIEVLQPTIARALEALALPFFDTIANGNPFVPTDFVNYLKYKTWQLYY